MNQFSPCPFCGAAAKRFGGMFARYDNGREKECGTHEELRHWLRSARCLAATNETGDFKRVRKGEV